ncbi:MAG: TIGR03986 family CRISPR-associated RAMP protein [Candidatus Schekmanbacteria bacterium]|nr:TIGR03986 family CRISPR-associated RAMP protein [Candidatus Schekmanbacteria bacterium]
MALERGELVVRETGKGKSPRIHIRIGAAMFNPARGEISQTVLDRLAELAGKEVELERVGGQPKRIREVGGSFVPPQREISEGGQDRPQSGRGGGSQPRRPQEPQERRERDMPRRQPDFHNPYNFVPAPPRNTSDADLGDQRPVDHDAFLMDRYSGSIRVHMTAKTPLLVPDTERAQERANGHKTFPLRVDADGKPLIPASSVRGMLRSAYEAVTNSRFGRFSESHKQRLKYRQSQRPFSKVDYPASAWDLLHDSLRPAAAIDQLSPADRVFGWVKVDADTGSRSRGERVAARGLLRVGPVRCESSTADAVERFAAPGLPLAILSAPKPQQGRFYVARSPNGEAQSEDLSKQDAGYTLGMGLRGRKVYPHQTSLPDGHWDDPTADRTQQPHGTPAHHQEYRRPLKNGQEQRDDQNRSILGWVKRGAKFGFDLQVQNLSTVELGALLWLLGLQEGCFFRFGGGKPLGFGSVRLEVVSLEVRTGTDLRARYDAWHDATPPNDPRTDALNAFRDAVVRAYPPAAGGFEGVAFIRTFLTACRGHGDNLPIHYPRATADGQPDPPSPDGESFKWFVANERDGARHALRDLASDTGLPTLPERIGGGGGGRPRQGGGPHRNRGGGGRR